MNKNDKLLVHFANYAVVISGVIYGILKYFFKVESNYGLMTHPLQPTFQHAHVLIAPLFVYSLGHIMKSHILQKLNLFQTPKKKSGLSLTILAVPMILSGYLLQVEITFKPIWLWSHIVISVLWIPVYLLHHIERVAKNP